MRVRSARTDDPRQQAKRVALVALAWMVVIAAVKLVVGLASGSVAMIADGLHSVLDTLIAVGTLYAVRLAAKPPDREHPYGHGRAENLVALAEAVIMAGVGVGVALEAFARLRMGADLEAPVYALVVTVVTIAIGAWRTRILLGAARRLRSPALEADATNQAADIVEGLAVFVGLFVTRVGLPAGDPIAAFVVAAIMFAMAIRIGIAATNVLMDRQPPHLATDVESAARGVDGVVDVADVRVRRSGPDVHAELTVTIGRTSSVERSHDITEAIEDAVSSAVSGATTTVHVEPSQHGEDIVSKTFAAANRIGLADQVHNVLAIDHPEGVWLMLHAKVPPDTPLATAHEVSDVLEDELRREIDGLARVEIHLEPQETLMLAGTVVSAQRADLVEGLGAIAEAHPPITRCHEVAITRAADGLHIVLHCEAPADTPISAIHDASTTLESDIHRRYGEVRTVTVHFEPQGP